MAWLDSLIAFFVEYWLFLTIVLVVLAGILVLLVVLNVKSRVHEEKEIPLDPVSKPIPAPIEVVEAEVMNPDPAFAESPTNEEQGGSELPPVSMSPDSEAPSVPPPVAPEPASNPPEKVVSSEVSPEDSVSAEPPMPIKPKDPPKPLGKYHVMYRAEDNRWYVKREGSATILRVLDTQREAISWAVIKALPKDIGIVVHDKDGKIKKAQPL